MRGLCLRGACAHQPLSPPSTPSLLTPVCRSPCSVAALFTPDAEGRLPLATACQPLAEGGELGTAQVGAAARPAAARERGGREEAQAAQLQAVAELLEGGAAEGVDDADAAGRTPLHEAAASGNPSVVRLLLESGADPCAVDGLGLCPYDVAAARAAQGGGSGGGGGESALASPRDWSAVLRVLTEYGGGGGDGGDGLPAAPADAPAAAGGATSGGRWQGAAAAAAAAAAVASTPAASASHEGFFTPEPQHQHHDAAAPPGASATPRSPGDGCADGRARSPGPGARGVSAHSAHSSGSRRVGWATEAKAPAYAESGAGGAGTLGGGPGAPLAQMRRRSHQWAADAPDRQQLARGQPPHRAASELLADAGEEEAAADAAAANSGDSGGCATADQWLQHMYALAQAGYLPPWELAWEPTYSCYFFHNLATGDSAWEPTPDMLAAAAALSYADAGWGKEDGAAAAAGSGIAADGVVCAGQGSSQPALGTIQLLSDAKPAPAAQQHPPPSPLPQGLAAAAAAAGGCSVLSPPRPPPRSVALASTNEAAKRALSPALRLVSPLRAMAQPPLHHASVAAASGVVPAAAAGQSISAQHAGAAAGAPPVPVIPRLRDGGLLAGDPAAPAAAAGAPSSASAPAAASLPCFESPRDPLIYATPRTAGSGACGAGPAPAAAAMVNVTATVPPAPAPAVRAAASEAAPVVARAAAGVSTAEPPVTQPAAAAPSAAAPQPPLARGTAHAALPPPPAPAPEATPAPAPSHSAAFAPAPAPSAAPAPRYVSMLRMGVPAEAVYRRMEADGAAEGEVAALQAAVRAHLAGGGAMARFMKPAAEEEATGAAAPAAAGEGAAAPAAAAVAGAAVLPAEAPAAAPADARKAAQEAVAGDPRFTKYSAMKRCGVPLGAIKGQMGADGLGREQVLTFLRAHATQAALESMQLLSPPGKGAGGRGASGGEAAGAAAGSARGGAADAAGDGDAAPSGPVTLKLHWDPLHLDDDRLQASVWGRLRSRHAAAATSTSSAGDAFALDSSSSGSGTSRSLESGAGGGADDAAARRPASPLSRDAAAGGSERGGVPSAPSLLHQEDVSFITNLFAAKQAAKPPAPPAGGGGPGAGSSGAGAAGSAAAGEAGPALQTTLDARRANNLNILLAQFRRFPNHAAIAAAVHRPGDGPLTRDALDKLSQLIPKPDELRAVKGFRGDPAALMECDRFFLAIARVPRFPAKVAACITLLSFPDIAADVTQRAGVVRDACAQVLASEGLQVVLGQALALGNLLNKGHSRLTAQAITLESLLKLASTKAADKKTSLMDALAVTLTSKHAAAAPAGAGAGTGAAGSPAGAASLDLAADLPLLAAARRIEVGEVASDLKQLQAAVLAACREAEAEAADLLREAEAAARAAAGPAVAVSANAGGGKSSALAEMMARRLASAGGAAPAAPPLPPASTSAAAPAPTAAARVSLPAAGSGNPCSTPDRQHFVDSLRAFGLAKQTALAEVQAAVAAADARLREVAAYFGEEPASATCASLLGPLLQFVGDFGASRKRAAVQQATAKGGKA